MGHSQFLLPLPVDRLKIFPLCMMGLCSLHQRFYYCPAHDGCLSTTGTTHKEGEQGATENYLSNLLAHIPLAMAQSYGMIVLISRGVPGSGEFIDVSDPLKFFPLWPLSPQEPFSLFGSGEMISEKELETEFRSLSLLNRFFYAGSHWEYPHFGKSWSNQKSVSVPLFVAVSAFLLIVMVIVMSAQRPIQIINASRNTTESVHRCLFVSFKREWFPSRYFSGDVSEYSCSCFFCERRFCVAIWCELVDAADFNQQRPTIEYPALYFFPDCCFSYFMFLSPFQKLIR